MAGHLGGHRVRPVRRPLSGLGGRSGHLVVGGPATGTHRRPAVDPVQRVQQRRSLGEAGQSLEVRVALVDGVVDRPPLATEVPEDRVVTGAHPPVAVHADHGGAADAAGEEAVALPVDERTERAAGPAGEHAVAGQRAVAAVAGRREQVVPVAVPHDVGALVAVADADSLVLGGRGVAGLPRRGGGHLPATLLGRVEAGLAGGAVGDPSRRPGAGHPVLGELDVLREDAAVVAAVVEDAAGPHRVAEDVRVVGPEVVALAVRVVDARRHHGCVADLPGAGGRRAGRDADRAVVVARRAAARCLRRVGDDEGHVVALVGAGVDDVGSPHEGPGVRPGRLRGEGVTHVGPVHEVPAAHLRHGVEVRDAVSGLAVVERVGGAVHVPPAGVVALAADHGRVGTAVDGPVGGDLRGQWVLVAGGLARCFRWCRGRCSRQQGGRQAHRDEQGQQLRDPGHPPTMHRNLQRCKGLLRTGSRRSDRVSSRATRPGRGRTST